MPGVLLVEAMAQTAGWLIVALKNFERMPFLAALKEVKLRSFVNPGARLALSARLIHDGSGFAVTEAECRIDGKIICDSTITFRIVPFPNAQFRASMREWAKRIEFPMETVGNG
jgi:3-hydroxyacyl-[acyl-carrier-protein] dehydratase